MTFDKRKAFGQHFLIDNKVIGQIVTQTLDELKTAAPARLLEIGPGRGALTIPLLESLPSKTLTVAEIDREFAKWWREEEKILQVIEGDFVKNTEMALNDLGPCIIVSNLPYASGTSILVELAKHPNQVRAMVLMFQREVADRVAAPPMAAKRGSLSVFIQNLWTVDKICDVPPASFKPAPKVWSQVIRLKPKPTPEIVAVTDSNFSRWNDLLRLAFAQRRKTLWNNLKSSEIWARALKSSDLDPSLRAEALSFEQWRKLWEQSSLS